MTEPLVAVLYLPVVVWVATGVGLVLAFRRSAPATVLRLAATFLAFWALLATTTLIWVLANGGWTAVVDLARSPVVLFQPQYWRMWFWGAIGAFLIFVAAFALNQLVGRGFLRLLATRPLPWPRSLARPRGTTLLAFRSDQPEAFSFTLLALGGSRRGVHRREVILLSEGLLTQFDAAEREATIAHELGHLHDLDGRYLTFLRTLSRMMRWDPLMAYLASSLTRREEYRADLEAVRATRHPLALARALYKATRSSALPSTPAGTGFLGAGGERGRREAYDRIRRLVALADSDDYREAAGG